MRHIYTTIPDGHREVLDTLKAQTGRSYQSLLAESIALLATEHEIDLPTKPLLTPKANPDETTK